MTENHGGNQGQEQPNPTERPRPAYGEYAPEGWQSPVPPLEQSPGQPSSQPPTGPAPASTASQAKPISGIPHNLGVTPGSGATTPQTQTQTQTPDQVQQQEPPQQDPALLPPGHTPETTQPVKRTVDRIVSVFLLLMGAYGALTLAVGMMNLGQQLYVFADAAGLEDFQPPASTGIIETIGAIVILSIFAIMLIWTIQRLRRKQLAFWVPIVAGILAFLVAGIFGTVLALQVPDLVANFTPETFNTIFQELNQTN